MKRVLAISDLHCGSTVGITPPKWFKNDYHKKLWAWYVRLCAQLQPINTLIVNGDAIDGKGQKSGGTEQLTADRNEQAEMAFEVIKATKAKQIVMTYGTPYHTGADEDWEDVVLNYVRDRTHVPVRISADESVSVNGLIFDVKHYVGGSQVPYGRFTAVSREKMQNILWSRRGQRADADVILRAHVHYFGYCGVPGDKYLCITMPALQGLGSKFGASRCSGTVDQGAIWFDIESKDNWTWNNRLIPQEKDPAALYIAR